MLGRLGARLATIFSRSTRAASVSARSVEQREPEVFRGLNWDDLGHGVDAQLATSSLVLPPMPATVAADRHFRTTSEFWWAVLSEDVRARRTVVLHDVLLSEWFPLSPGLYYTKQGADAREKARGHILPLSAEEQATYDSSQPPNPVVYDLNGKRQMLRGGIGCVRLTRKLTPDGPLWFMSASTYLSAEQGVPLALTDADYEQYIDDITKHGVLACTVTGKLTFLPESLLSLYRDYSGVPGLYVLVEKIERGTRAIALQQGRCPTVSVAVMFTSDHGVSATYVDFVPGQTGTLDQRLPWLDYYVARHGGTVITDFDEQMTRFPHAVFSLQKVTSGTLKESELMSVAHHLGLGTGDIQWLLAQQRHIAFTVNRFHIEVGKVEMGDVFSNIGAGAVIVNRATLTNALNSVRADHGAETANALQHLGELVGQSGKPEAVDNLNGLTEELEKPQPNKNRLKTWLDGIASALPTVAHVTEAVVDVAKLLL
jgi:hypothetical protein